MTVRCYETIYIILAISRGDLSFSIRFRLCFMFLFNFWDWFSLFSGGDARGLRRDAAGHSTDGRTRTRRDTTVTCGGAGPRWSKQGRATAAWNCCFLTCESGVRYCSFALNCWWMVMFSCLRWGSCTECVLAFDLFICCCWSALSRIVSFLLPLYSRVYLNRLSLAISRGRGARW